MVKLFLGDCLETMKKLEDNSVDSIVCDPPYGLSFMNKKWDYDVPSVKIWRECLRVLKPGGHLLAFAGSRTYHVMAMRIENAGFEIRDQIMWIYGQGFPKSLDISKAIDKKVGAKREVLYKRKPQGTARPNKNGGGHSCAHTKSGTNYLPDDEAMIDITAPAAPAAPAAQRWSGWGTALKPAHEPIVVAMKPISEDTIESNVLEHGTGGINVDDCKIGNEVRISASASAIFGTAMKRGPENVVRGRWPTNVLFDEEAALMLDEQNGQVRGAGVSRFFYVPKTSKSERNAGCDSLSGKKPHEAVDRKEGSAGLNSPRAGAGRGRVEEIKNHHPTLKPIKLMEYLVRLVTPPKGIVLDPFMGSGSTGCAAVREGFSFIGCELSDEYFKIAEARIKHHEGKPKTKIKSRARV